VRPNAKGPACHETVDVAPRGRQLDAVRDVCDACGVAPMTKPRFYVTGDSEDTMEAHRLNRRVQRMDQRRLEAEPAVGSLEHPVHRLDKPTASATARHERGEQVFFVAMRVDD